MVAAAVLAVVAMAAVVLDVVGSASGACGGRTCVSFAVQDVFLAPFAKRCIFFVPFLVASAMGNGHVADDVEHKMYTGSAKCMAKFSKTQRSPWLFPKIKGRYYKPLKILMRTIGIPRERAPNVTQV